MQSFFFAHYSIEQSYDGDFSRGTRGTVFSRIIKELRPHSWWASGLLESLWYSSSLARGKVHILRTSPDF